MGCDRAAVLGAASAMEIVPYGLDLRRKLPPGRCRLSASAPGAEFTSAAAMERNALIYAASEHTVVISARFKEGGTWIGATEALRRKLTRLVVRRSPSDAASRALIALGAIPLDRPEDLQLALLAAPATSSLFEGLASV